MEQPDSKQSIGRWDLGFFARNIPSRRKIQSDFLRTAIIGPPAKPGIDQLRDRYPAFEDFCARCGPDGPLFVAIRVNTSSESEAFEAGWELFSHMADALMFTVDLPPLAAPVVLIRSPSAANAVIREFSTSDWTVGTPHNAGEALNLWEQQKDEVLKHLLPLLNATLDSGWEKKSPLLVQVAYSARLFRRGSLSGSYGVEFLSKFSAMEGLVTSGDRNQKRVNLVDRLVKLIGSHFDWDVAAVVSDLWDRRNAVAHEARAEFFRAESDSYPLQLLTPKLDKICTALIVFAVDNLTKASSVKELWQLVDQYTLPECVRCGPPAGVTRLPASTMLVNRNEIWTGAGQWFDAVFEAGV